MIYIKTVDGVKGARSSDWLLKLRKLWYDLSWQSAKGWMDVYHLKNLVTQSTRLTKSTETLIDLILTNNKRRALQTGVVDTQISDHSLVYTIMRVTLPRLRSRKIALRSFKNFDRDKFVEDLSAAPFLTRELRACARASCRYVVENGTRSLARLVDSCKLFFDFGLLSAFNSFWWVINKRNGDLCCQE